MGRETRAAAKHVRYRDLLVGIDAERPVAGGRLVVEDIDVFDQRQRRRFDLGDLNERLRASIRSAIDAPCKVEIAARQRRAGDARIGAIEPSRAVRRTGGVARRTYTRHLHHWLVGASLSSSTKKPSTCSVFSCGCEISRRSAILRNSESGAVLRNEMLRVDRASRNRRRANAQHSGRRQLTRGFRIHSWLRRPRSPRLQCRGSPGIVL